MPQQEVKEAWLIVLPSIGQIYARQSLGCQDFNGKCILQKLQAPLFIAGQRRFSRNCEPSFMQKVSRVQLAIFGFQSIFH
mmetsp:Transcript_27081/g.64447  ORF Transcript_27081/g.64447 Transcript_27081/m.64447 type:complete len:80 (+) Transcript_27081:1130-1369(+)